MLNGRQVTKGEALRIVKSTGEGPWTSYREKTGVGDYGYREIYKFDGNPVVAYEIDYTSGGKATAFDLREVPHGER